MILAWVIDIRALYWVLHIDSRHFLAAAPHSYHNLLITTDSEKRMILTCPECATRFKVADDAVGANGRTVRCSQCSVTWFVAAEPDVLSLEDAEEITEMRQEVIREPVSDFVPDSVSDSVSDVDVGMDSELPNANADDIKGSIDDNIDSVLKDSGLKDSGLKDSAAGVGAHAAIRENADRKKSRRRLFGVGMIWLVTLVILALFALLAYLFRAQIVERFPGAAPIYQAIGLEANASGLEIYDIITRYGNNEGVQVLFVSGKIKNFDRKTRDVDMIKLSFKNQAGEVLNSWVVEPPQTTLKPGKTIKFTSQYPNPPIDAVKLAPEFVTETSVQTEQPMVSQ